MTTSHVLNGELLNIGFQANVAGSVTLSNVDTGEVFLNTNFASGTNSTTFYPRIFSQAITGSIANAEHVRFPIDNKVNLLIDPASSGTGFTIDATLRYQ